MLSGGEAGQRVSGELSHPVAGCSSNVHTKTRGGGGRVGTLLQRWGAFVLSRNWKQLYSWPRVYRGYNITALWLEEEGAGGGGGGGERDKKQGSIKRENLSASAVWHLWKVVGSATASVHRPYSEACRVSHFTFTRENSHSVLPVNESAIWACNCRLVPFSKNFTSSMNSAKCVNLNGWEFLFYYISARMIRIGDSIFIAKTINCLPSIWWDMETDRPIHLSLRSAKAIAMVLAKLCNLATGPTCNYSCPIALLTDGLARSVS